MRYTDFVAPGAGHLVSTIQEQWAFVPAPLPPDIMLNEIAFQLADAMQAVGELRGACRRLQEPAILIRPLQRQEALTSSAMEGTFTTADQLVLAEAGLDSGIDDSTREVVNYLTALNESLRLLDELPLCHRVFTTAHRLLLGGLSPARGASKQPGEYKTEQNWIGGRTIESARFVPPPPAEAQGCMDALERYLNRDRSALSEALIDIALAHYQLEAIHPFADGNGRVGRMLIPLMAVQSGLLDMPVLYVSPALEADKDSYIDLMFNVSARAEWSQWLNFFFIKVRDASLATIATIDRLIALQAEYRRSVGEAIRSAKAITLVDMLFERPAITITEAASKLSITYAAAKNIVDKLVETGVLTELPLAYPKTFLAMGVIQAARA